MRALLLIAHGSRRPQSNQEVQALAQSIDQRDIFDRVQAAFLELATPSIEEGIAQCVQAGADRIEVLPYFLSAGRHVSQDIPQIIQAQQAHYPQVQIKLWSHLGALPGMADFILAGMQNEKDLFQD